MAKFLISAFADEAHNGINGQVEALKRNGLFCIEPRAMNFGAVLAKTDEELAAMIYSDLVAPEDDPQIQAALESLAK